MLPILPLEIWDSIIDWLDGDYSTLLTCMLVCKSWEPRSRYNLLGWMTFDNHDDILQVAQQNGSLWKGPRRVQVQGSPRSEPEHKLIPHLSTFSAMLAGRWTRVQELYIEHAEWCATDVTPLVFLHLSAFSSVTSLMLGYVAFPSIATLRRHICCFPNLQSFKCYELSFLAQGAAPPVSVKWPPSIQILSLDKFNCGASDIDVEDPLLASDTVALLRDLIDLRNIGSPAHPRALAALQGLVDAAGTPLSALKLYLDTGSKQDRIAESAQPPSPSLVPSSKLETLELHLYCVSGCTDYDWVFRCLLHVTSDSIKTVQISLWLEDALPADIAVASIGQDCCARLDEVSSSLPAFARLQKIVLNFLYNVYDPMWQTLARELWPQVTSQMPRLHKRGVLRLY